MSSNPEHILNPFELENLRSDLLEKISVGSSINARLYAYLNYFQKILSFNRPNIEEAFLSEFLEDYLNVVKRYDVWGNDPEVTSKIIEQLKTLRDRLFFNDYNFYLNNEIARLESQWTELKNILNGIASNKNDIRKAFFPVIDKEAPINCFGLIESVTVRINKTESEDKFIIIPSEKEIEQRIAEQIKISWQLALEISSKYVRKHNKYHEVIISFDKKAGFYVGNSLGISLTLTFLEQILKFYNPAYIINLRENSAFTGGIDREGNVLNTGEDIIKRKVAAIFYSELNSFVIPKLEETYAYFSLEQLRKVYPHRKLKLITAEDIDDILNRRDLVEIKKQKVIVRTGKFVRKNWVAALIVFSLIAIISFFIIKDFDNNPVSFTADGTKLYIKNKSGKVLWVKNVSVGKRMLNNPLILRRIAKIVDINSDEMSEVILCGEKQDDSSDGFNPATVRCYNYEDNLIWQYSFGERVTSEREKLSLDYGSTTIIDTITFNGKSSLFLFSSNHTSFSSAIYRIDLETGERLSGTFWASGHIMDAVIKDIDDDNKPEIVGVGYENGYEDFVFFAYEIDTLTKVRPTTDEYLIKGFPVAEMKSYIRFPKTDFDNFYKIRTPGYTLGSFTFEERKRHFTFATDLPKKTQDEELGYLINYDLKVTDIVIDSDFRVQRDTLVAQGILKPPYTDTEEYKEIIKNKILYWKKGKWVDRFGNEKNKLPQPKLRQLF